MTTLVGVFLSSALFATEYVKTDLYTLVGQLPTEEQYDPLSVLIERKFPVTQFKSVEDAIHSVLDESGYELQPSELWPPEMRIMMGNRIPEIHRELTPMTIKNALSVLAGRPFSLVTDPLRRKITFVLKNEYRGLIDE